MPVKAAMPIVECLPWLMLAAALWIERRSSKENLRVIIGLLGGLAMVWLLSSVLTFAPDEVLVVFRSVFQSLLFGVIMMGILAVRLARPSRGATFPGMLTISGLSGGAMLYALVDRGDDSSFIPSIIGLLIVWLTTLVSMVAAAKLCRGRARVTRFILFMLLGSFVLLFAFFAIFVSLEKSAMRWDICLGISAGLAAGIILSLIPVFVLWFLHPGPRSPLSDLLHLGQPDQAG